MVKEERNEAQKQRRRKGAVIIAGFCMLLVGVMVAMMFVMATQPYWELRADEYMDDPTIPYDQRDNATYTFTDQWLEDKYNRLTWYAVPWGVLAVVGFILIYVPDGIITDKQIHTNLCSGNGVWKYCPECGLKLSKLEEG